MPDPQTEAGINNIPPKCELCGEPMPSGEEMFKFHGYSGPCPKPPLPRDIKTGQNVIDKLNDREWIGRLMHESWTKTIRDQGFHHPVQAHGHTAAGLPRCPKCHDDLVPWDELPEKQKDINRHAFDAVLDAVLDRASDCSTWRAAGAIPDEKQCSQCGCRETGSKGN